MFKTFQNIKTSKPLMGYFTPPKKKKKNLLSFTQPQVVSKPVWKSFFCWTQKKIF